MPMGPPCLRRPPLARTAPLPASPLPPASPRRPRRNRHPRRWRASLGDGKGPLVGLGFSGLRLCLRVPLVGCSRGCFLVLYVPRRHP